MEYPTLAKPRTHDRLLAPLYAKDSTWSEREKIGINRCRVTKKLLWLSDAVTVDGRYLEADVLDKGSIDSGKSRYKFPQEKPLVSDWKAWSKFLHTLVGRDKVLTQPLGLWIGETGR